MAYDVLFIRIVDVHIVDCPANLVKQNAAVVLLRAQQEGDNCFSEFCLL